MVYYHHSLQTSVEFCSPCMWLLEVNSAATLKYICCTHVLFLLCTAAGLVTRDDMQIMLRQLAGSSLNDDDINCLVSRALQEADSPQGLTLQAFRNTLRPKDLGNMMVQVPTELSA